MGKFDYSKLSEIVVKSQQELDDIPLDFKGRIYIEFGVPFDRAIVRNNYYLSVEAWGNSSVVAWGNSSVVAWGNSSVVAWGNSSVVAWGNSSVVARENSSVVAWENSSVVAWENSSVEAWGNSSVVARENSSVEAWGNSSVEAWGNSSVEARENSSVVARENSSVVARENSSVVARENSSVEARENSSVVARENSSVEAWGNSSVEAWGNSSVEGNGNSQINDKSLGTVKIKISGNSRIVYNPKNINDFIDFYGIKHTKTKAIFYKAVRKVGDRYFANYNKKFEYIIGKTKEVDYINENVNEDCGCGIHISHLNWALNFGRSWENLAILELEVKINDIVCPTNTDGKVRASRVKVLREVPLEECGLYGEILARQRNNKGSV